MIVTSTSGDRSKLLSLVRSFACVGFVITVAVVSSAACSSNAVVACDDTKCAAGNKCLPLNGEVKCRKTCTSNSDATQSCPFGYTCTDTLTGAPPFCVQDQAKLPDGRPIAQKQSGQWGASCVASNGFENPGCDGEQGFRCYGVSPTDGDAYCTRYDCTKDEECGKGFWCATINATPSVLSARRTSVGEVRNVCLRRTFCTPCQADLDCPPVLGTPQHCIQDVNGASFCSPECSSSANCAKDAKCVDAGIGATVCYPRAQVCVGDGTLCSPCRSDVDCGQEGICVKGQYTTEKSCATKSTAPCEEGKSRGSCPDKSSGPPEAAVRCLGGALEEVPRDYCHGIYFIGSDSGDVGCWTPDR
jgi:hypothetical protein